MQHEKQQQGKTFSNFIKQGSVATDVTYKIVFVLGKRGKSFNDVEIIKECFVEAMEYLDPEKVRNKQLPLSGRTITDR